MIEPKQKEVQTKQFYRELILVFFSENLGVSGLFWFVLVCFETVSFEPKQTEDQPKQFDRGHILVFLEN